MTTIVHPATFAANAAWHFRRFAVRTGRSLCAAILARATRRALNELPDDLLRDVGLTRGEIPFVADAVACAGRSPGHDAHNCLGGSCGGPRCKPACFAMKIATPEPAALASFTPK